MQSFVRIVAFTFLVVFTAGSVMHPVSANAMALEMALASDDAMSMPDCQGCTVDERGNADLAACDLACTVPVVATTDNAGGPVHVALLSRQERPLAENLPLGLRGPPDLFPPRSLI